MSSFRAAAAGTRVLIIHDMPDRTIVSEFEISQADVLLEQMQAALGMAIAAVRAMSVEEIADVG